MSDPLLASLGISPQDDCRTHKVIFAMTQYMSLNQLLRLHHHCLTLGFHPEAVGEAKF